MTERSNEAEEMASRVLELDLPDAAKSEIARWLTQPRFAAEHLRLEQDLRSASTDTSDPVARARALAELEDAFSGPLPIGTGGRRGICGAGPNRINTVVLRETAQGLVRALANPDFSGGVGRPAARVAVAFDTRRDSAAFARLVCAQLAAGGCEVLLLDAPRPTPQLSFFMRRERCGAGIVITASHNPPGDNGIKIYGPDGAQVLGAGDRALLDGIAEVREGTLPAIEVANALAGSLPSGVERVDPAADPRADAAYHAHVLEQGTTQGSLSEAGIRVAFTPLHGVGHTSVVPVLRARGIEVFPVERQCDPDGGRFSTVESANPEVPSSMAMAIALAGELRAELVLATDPDADRLGACVRAPIVGAADPVAYLPIDGNRLGVLMLDQVLRCALLPPDGWVLTTMVSSPLIATLARASGLEVVDDLLVGFKHHAGMVHEQPGRPVVFACEESHGYLRGNEVRDKDAAMAALLLVECAATCKRRGTSLLGRLDELWAEHGYHREQTSNLWAHGGAGREAIAAVMQAWRVAPPEQLGGLAVREHIDRNACTRPPTGSPTRDLLGNVLVLELAAGSLSCRLVLRPSGTEPKLKLYALAHARGGAQGPALEASKREVDALAAQVLEDARVRAETIMAPWLAGAR